MSLKLILGPSGSGKSRRLFETALSEASGNMKEQYLILVPEQFTMQTQQELCSLSPVGGILNIDILSFSRLAVRVFEETGVRRKTLLKETGKSLLLRLIADRDSSGLSLLSGAVDRPGVLSELKSILSEMDQYEISDDALESMAKECGGRPALAEKLRQLKKLREKYRQFQEEHGFQTIETVPEALCQRIPLSRRLNGCHVYLDGYTGFTPAQLDVLNCLMRKAASITVTVTVDPGEDLYGRIGEEDLFALSKRTVQTLIRLAQDTGTEVEEPVVLPRKGPGRFVPGSQLACLEEHIFRNGKKKVLEYGRKTGGTDPEDAGGEESAAGRVRILSCQDPLEESEAAVSIIRKLTRREKDPLRYRDIAVVVGNFQTYAEYLRRTCSMAEIPFFVDRSVPVTLNPAFEFVKAAMGILDAGYSYESMMAFFRTGFVFDDRETVDRLENYLLSAGIRTARAWNNKWERSSEGFPEEALPELEEIRRGFVEKFAPFAEVFRHSSASLKDYASALWNMMDRFQLQKKLHKLSEDCLSEGNPADAQIYGQAAGVVASVLDEAVSLLGGEKVRRSQFEQILEAGFAEAKIGIIPPGTDQVHIGDLTRSRLTDVKAVLFLGMNDEYVPQRKSGRGILTDMEREYLKSRDFHLAPTAREDAAIQKYYLYLCLSKPSDYLVLSWSRMGADGSVMRPSPVLKQVRQLLPEVREEEGIPGGTAGNVYLPGETSRALSRMLASSRNWSSEERKQNTPSLRELYLCALTADPDRTEELVRALEPEALPKLEQRIARRLYGDVLEGSVSRLEKFAQCPYLQFGVYGLRLQDRPRFEVRASDVGSIMHRAMEILAEKVDRSIEYTWQTLPREVCGEWADESLREASLEMSGGKFEDSFRSAGQLMRLRRIFRYSADIMRLQLLAGAFRPAFFEVKFDSRDRLTADPVVFENGSRMHLTGRIDRIDESVDREHGRVYVKIIDYKTGGTEFDLRKVYMGTELQLLVYMDSALKMERRKHPGDSILCAGMLYFPVRDPVLEAKMAGRPASEIEEERRKKVRPNGLVLEDPDAITRLCGDASLLPQVAPVSLNKDGSLSKNSSTATGEQMKLLSDFSGWKMKEAGRRIFRGEIAPSPLWENERQTACTWCSLRPVCQFTGHDPRMKFRSMEKGSRDEIWAKIADAVLKQERQDGEKLD